MGYANEMLLYKPPFLQARGRMHPLSLSRAQLADASLNYCRGDRVVSGCKDSLKPNGTYVLTSFKMRDVVDMLWTSVTGSKKVKCAILVAKPEDLISINDNSRGARQLLANRDQ